MFSVKELSSDWCMGRGRATKEPRPCTRWTIPSATMRFRAIRIVARETAYSSSISASVGNLSPGSSPWVRMRCMRAFSSWTYSGNGDDLSTEVFTTASCSGDRPR